MVRRKRWKCLLPKGGSVNVLEANLEPADTIAVCGAVCLLRHSEGRWQRHQPDEASDAFDEFCQLDDSLDWGLELGDLLDRDDSDLECNSDCVCIVTAEAPIAVRDQTDDGDTRGAPAVQSLTSTVDPEVDFPVTERRKLRRGRLRRLSKCMSS